MAPTDRYDTPSKAVVVVPWLQGGGAQTALIEVLRRLDRKPQQLIIIFSGSRDFDAVFPYVTEIRQLEHPRTPLGVMHAARDLRRLTAGADVVYSLLRASHAVLGLAGIRSRVTTTGASFHQLPSTDARTFLGRLEEVLVRRYTKTADLVTSPSNRAVHEIRQRALARPEALVLEHNFVPVSETILRPPRDGVLERVNLLFAGRLTSQKGLDQIPALFAASATPISLRIFGDGELRPLVENLAAKLDPPHQITLHGHSDDLVGELDHSDAVLLPSRWELNPLIIWEAWSRGRPVIASALEVHQDLEPVGPIRVFETTEDFGDTIIRLATDLDLRRQAFADGPVSVRRHNEQPSHIAELFNRALRTCL